MEITGIAPQVKDKSRCNIEVDGRFFCGMRLETVLENRLKVGSVVSEEQLSALQLSSEKMTAFDKALTHISVSMKTEKEIRDFLSRKGYLSDVTDYVIERMKEHSFIDDAAYAQAYCESAGRRKGRKLIALELRRRGVADDVIEEALSMLTGEEDSAARILEKYLRGKPHERKTFAKAYAYLISKGYDYEVARIVLAKIEDEYDD